MPHSASQAFLRELDKKLWTAADRLRSNLDAAVYKQAVFGLIFLKLIDAVAEKHLVQFICLDRALQGNDSLKVNTLEAFRAAQREIQFRIV